MPISSHLKAVRDKVGHDLLSTSAGLVSLFDDGGWMLLRQDTKTGPTLAGGAVDTSRRRGRTRMLLETGLLVRSHRVIDMFTSPQFRIQYPNGDLTYYTVVAFEGTQIGGALKGSWPEDCGMHLFDRKVWDRLSISPSSRLRNPQPYFAPPHGGPDIIPILLR